MEQVKTITVGNTHIGDGKLFVMAGPCVIEDPERVLRIGREMKKICDALGVPYIFKASYDKANRSSYASYRGPGLTEGLRILKHVKEELGVPVVSDVHEVAQVGPAAEVLDVLQIPAFLCRQTDLLEAAAETGKCVNVKKGQFMAPEDMKNVVDKIRHKGNENIMLTERGVSLGYHNLVVDMRSFPIMRSFGYPVVFDATHSVQLPGGAGTKSSGQRQFIGNLARAAAGSGIDGVFMEVHDNPAEALSDGPNMLYLSQVEAVLRDMIAIHEITKHSVSTAKE